jgi:signal transduction histidine kinase
MENTMSTTVLLPPEVAANTSRWFGRARNYPIYSLPWLRYRSVSMLIGSALFIIVGVALVGWSRAPARDRTVDLLKAFEGSLAYLVTAAAAILVGPALAVGVRRLRLRPRFETLAIAAVLGLGLFFSFGIVQKLTMSWYARGSYDSLHDVVVYDRLVFVFDFDVRRRPANAVIGLRDPVAAQTYLNAYDNYARQFGLPDRLQGGWPHFMTAEDRRLIATLRDPALAPSARHALEGPYADLLKKVYRETANLHWRGYRGKRTAMTPEQTRAESMLLASMRADVPAPVAVDKDVARRVHRASSLVLLLAHLALFAWLGGVFELFAFVRQRGMLGDAHARQELERARAERNAAETRLSVLAAQVEPHFLFNTLASVRAALATDPQRAGHIVDHMTDYLRSTIPQMRGDALAATVALDTQLAAARAYLALMHERMVRLQFGVDAEPGLERASIPPLMLISLVENAVKHGVEPKIGPARVDVRARRAGAGVLEVRVEDDGVGFGAAASGSGIGLANIQQRLRALYGAHASLELKARPEGGVAATLRLPLIFES